MNENEELKTLPLEFTVYRTTGGREIVTASTLTDAIRMVFRGDVDRVEIFEYPDGDKSASVYGLIVKKINDTDWKIDFIAQD
jgi:hypothetical protein